MSIEFIPEEQFSPRSADEYFGVGRVVETKDEDMEQVVSDLPGRTRMEQEEIRKARAKLEDLLRYVDKNKTWLVDAACKNKNELFFGAQDEDRKARNIRQQEMKATCERCPVLNMCDVKLVNPL